mmetsp:Transcript_11441/g.14475  ORF Transcript_11441/g.14475 Transcript_11441/m.14475 type:complete len:87 (-) Transcript_11441:681-941(-)
MDQIYSLHLIACSNEVREFLLIFLILQRTSPSKGQLERFAYISFCGTPPFNAGTNKNRFHFPVKDWDDISFGAINLSGIYFNKIKC